MCVNGVSDPWCVRIEDRYLVTFTTFRIYMYSVAVKGSPYMYVFSSMNFMHLGLVDSFRLDVF